MKSKISKGKVMFFPHDVKATSDIKIQKLIRKYGMRGVGIFWYIIEYLYENDGILEYDQIETIAWTLHEEIDTVDDIIKNFELFSSVCDNTFSNARVLREMEEIRRIIADRREKGLKSGESRKKSDNDISSIKENPKVPYSLPDVVETKDLAEYLKSCETSWKDAVAMNIGVKPNDLDSLFDEYQNEIFLQGKSYETGNEARNHFLNLMRKKLKERSNDGRKYNNKQQLSQDDISTAVSAGSSLNAYEAEARSSKNKQ